MEKLSEHFSWEEMTSTSHKDLLVLNQHEAEAFKDNLKQTVTALEEIRALVGSMTVSSGFRGLSLNKRVGGSATSSHSKGLAADIIPNKMKVVDAFHKLLVNKDKIPNVKKIILEQFGGKEWLHIQGKIDLKEKLEVYSTKDGKSYTPVK